MKKLELVLLFICAALNVGLKTFAAEPDYINDSPLESMLSHGTIHEGGIIRSLVSLAIVIGLIYLTAWIYKNLNKFNTQKFSQKTTESEINKFKLVSAQSLGANKSLNVVEINNKYLVLGVTQHNINLLTEFDKFELEKSLSIENKDSTDKWINDLADKYDDLGDNNAKRN